MKRVASGPVESPDCNWRSLHMTRCGQWEEFDSDKVRSMGGVSRYTDGCSIDSVYR